jgi:single-strand DNA-binding protein
MNYITIIGNVAEPELRYTTSGKALLKFGLATSRGKDDDKVTTWHNVQVWGEMAENAAAVITKGSRVIVVGKIEVNTYQDKTGANRKDVLVVADDVAVSLRWKTAE